MIQFFSTQQTHCIYIAAITIFLFLDRSATAFSPPQYRSSGEASCRRNSGIAIETSILLSLSNDDYAQTTNRRSWLGQTGVAMIFIPSIAWADYGKSTSMAAPGVVPSPIRPSGEMAKTCEVVALGREDICLVPLKLPSAYDRVLIERALDTIGDGDGDGKRVKVAALLRSLSVADWVGFERELSQPSLEGISKATVKSLLALRQKKDAPTAIKAVLKLAEKL